MEFNTTCTHETFDNFQEDDNASNNIAEKQNSARKLAVEEDSIDTLFSDTSVDVDARNEDLPTPWNSLSSTEIEDWGIISACSEFQAPTKSPLSNGHALSVSPVSSTSLSSPVRNKNKLQNLLTRYYNNKDVPYSVIATEYVNKYLVTDFTATTSTTTTTTTTHGRKNSPGVVSRLSANKLYCFPFLCSWFRQPYAKPLYHESLICSLIYQRRIDLIWKLGVELGVFQDDGFIHGLLTEAGASAFKRVQKSSVVSNDSRGDSDQSVKPVEVVSNEEKATQGLEDEEGNGKVEMVESFHKQTLEVFRSKLCQMMDTSKAASEYQRIKHQLKEIDDLLEQMGDENENSPCYEDFRYSLVNTGAVQFASKRHIFPNQFQKQNSEDVPDFKDRLLQEAFETYHYDLLVFNKGALSKQGICSATKLTYQSSFPEVLVFDYNLKQRMNKKLKEWRNDYKAKRKSQRKFPCFNRWEIQHNVNTSNQLLSYMRDLRSPNCERHQGGEKNGSVLYNIGCKPTKDMIFYGEVSEKALLNPKVRSLDLAEPVVPYADSKICEGTGISSLRTRRMSTVTGTYYLHRSLDNFDRIEYAKWSRKAIHLQRMVTGFYHELARKVQEQMEKRQFPCPVYNLKDLNIENFPFHDKLNIIEEYLIPRRPLEGTKGRHRDIPPELPGLKDQYRAMHFDGKSVEDYLYQVYLEKYKKELLNNEVADEDSLFDQDEDFEEFILEFGD